MAGMAVFTCLKGENQEKSQKSAGSRENAGIKTYKCCGQMKSSLQQWPAPAMAQGRKEQSGKPANPCDRRFFDDLASSGRGQRIDRHSAGIYDR
jgi:hypothetical protein